MDRIFKIAVNIPEEFVKDLTEKVNFSMTQIYPGYDMVFSLTKVTGMWRPLQGSDPYKGEAGTLTTANEIRVDFAVREDDLKSAIESIISVHPYEEPAIDVIPMYAWKSFIR
ncbi:MAG: hypothetical protein AB7D42_04090 [Candidatus Methanomethylophilaceae archaeon]|nr:hypothetical protein [Candidatus Methanomethylophilaceae archaeon]